MQQGKAAYMEKWGHEKRSKGDRKKKTLRDKRKGGTVRRIVITKEN